MLPDCWDQEEKGDNRETKATKDHRVFQGLQDLGDQLDLLGYQDQKVKQANLVNLAIPERETQAPLVRLAPKAVLDQAALLDFRASRDRLVPQDLPPLIPTSVRSSP